MQNGEISPKQGFGSTGHSRQISTLRSAGSLQSAICATRMLYYRPGRTNSLFETPPTHTTPLPALLLLQSNTLCWKMRFRASQPHFPRLLIGNRVKRLISWKIAPIPALISKGWFPRQRNPEKAAVEGGESTVQLYLTHCVRGACRPCKLHNSTQVSLHSCLTALLD